MSQKRSPDDSKAKSERGSPEDKRRKGPAFSSLMLGMMKWQSDLHLLEPMLRRVVKEEVELALKKHISSMKQTCEKEIHTFESRSLQLQFVDNISLPIFTGARIEGEDGSNLRLGLVDALTGQVVSSGPVSAAKVEIVVLEGDFEDGSDIWTPEEFRSNIVKERDGKKPLLTGDVFLNLKDGIGMVGEMSFTDNSSWTRSRKFKLGARVVNNFDRFRIKEAKTESFIVRDHRGELYKKHHPPSLSDEVWRLEKIGKDGAFHKRLSQEKIKTVEDFLNHLNLDSAKLRSILGTGMSAKMWQATVDHARTCVLDARRFLYFASHSQTKTGVVFNAVGQVTGLLSECQYVPVDQLSETEKALFSNQLFFFSPFTFPNRDHLLKYNVYYQADAQNSVIYAIKQKESFASFDNEASLMDASSHLTNVLFTSHSPSTEGSGVNKLSAPQKTSGFDYLQASASSPDVMSSVYSVGGTSGLDEFVLPNFDSMGFKYDQTLAFGNDDHLQFFDTDSQSQCHILDKQLDLQNAVDDFMLHSTAIGKAQRRWRKLFNVLKWFMIRNISLKRSRD